ncbi:hypothetical protein D1871_00810 [Nakamurella silvestris]|nr:hypothetical protein D1871_00810 [Nakamurella silvestris]
MPSPRGSESPAPAVLPDPAAVALFRRIDRAMGAVTSVTVDQRLLRTPTVGSPAATTSIRSTYHLIEGVVVGFDMIGEADGDNAHLIGVGGRLYVSRHRRGGPFRLVPPRAVDPVVYRARSALGAPYDQAGLSAANLLLARDFRVERPPAVNGPAATRYTATLDLSALHSSGLSSIHPVIAANFGLLAGHGVFEVGLTMVVDEDDRLVWIRLHTPVRGMPVEEVVADIAAAGRRVGFIRTFTFSDYNGAAPIRGPAPHEIEG